MSKCTLASVDSGRAAMLHTALYVYLPWRVFSSSLSCWQIACHPTGVCFKAAAIADWLQVINHLIRRAQVFAVSYMPDPRPGQSDADYAIWAQNERTLTLHENFNPDP